MEAASEEEAAAPPEEEPVAEAAEEAAAAAAEDEDEPGMWEETFKSHTDSKPFGPTSVGVDVSFPAARFVYGIPEHADNFALKSTKYVLAELDGKTKVAIGNYLNPMQRALNSLNKLPSSVQSVELLSHAHFLSGRAHLPRFIDRLSVAGTRTRTVCTTQTSSSTNSTTRWLSTVPCPSWWPKGEPNLSQFCPNSVPILSSLKTYRSTMTFSYSTN